MDDEPWLERYAQLHNTVGGSHGHQKDWLDLDDLRARGIRKAMIHASLVMLTEAIVAYTRVQNGVTERLTSLAGLRWQPRKSIKRRILLAETLHLNIPKALLRDGIR